MTPDDIARLQPAPRLTVEISGGTAEERAIMEKIVMDGRIAAHVTRTADRITFCGIWDDRLD